MRQTSCNGKRESSCGCRSGGHSPLVPTSVSHFDRRIWQSYHMRIWEYGRKRQILQTDRQSDRTGARGEAEREAELKADQVRQRDRDDQQTIVSRSKSPAVKELRLKRCWRRRLLLFRVDDWSSRRPVPTAFLSESSEPA